MVWVQTRTRCGSKLGHGVGPCRAHQGPRWSAHAGTTQGPDGAPMQGPSRALGRRRRTRIRIRTNSQIPTSAPPIAPREKICRSRDPRCDTCWGEQNLEVFGLALELFGVNFAFLTQICHYMGPGGVPNCPSLRLESFGPSFIPK